MAHQRGKGIRERADIEEKVQDGIKVRNYSLKEGKSTLIDLLSEDEIQDAVDEYDRKVREAADKDFQRRMSALDEKMAKELNEEEGLEEQEKKDGSLEPSELEQKLKTLTKDDRIAVIGDSIVYGFEVEGSLTWIGKLRREEEINLLNLGINGDTTGNMLSRFYEHVVGINAKACLIMGGGNDIMGETPLDYVSNNIVMMTQMALDKGIIPMIGVEPEPDHNHVPPEWKTIIDYETAKTNIRLYNDWLRELAKQNHFPLIDFDREMKNRLRAGYGRYFFDGVHPNPAGHSMMAKIAKDEFIKMGLLKKKDPIPDDKFAL